MDRDELPQRMSSMDIGGDVYIERKPSRKRSESRPSILRRSTSTSIPEPIDYELWRFQKDGDEWTQAFQKQLPASQKDLVKKVRSKSKNGTALEQIQKMGPNRLGQVDELVEKKSRQTGLRWEPAWMENVQSSISRNNKRDVRVFDVIIARAGLNNTRPSLFKARTNSISTRGGERVVLKDRTNSFKDNYDGERKDWKDMDSGYSKQGGGKHKEVVDPDPFGNSKLFAPSGKPLEPDGAIPFDEVHLPPHIREDEPIGKKIPKKRSKSHHGDDPDEIVEVLDDDGGFKEGGAGEILDSMNFDNILPKSKGKKKKGSQSRSRSKGTTRNRSRSMSRNGAHNEHRSKGSERVGRYMEDHGSISSNGTGDTNFMMEDDNSSFTSSLIHHDMAERGSLHRRGSSKHEKLPFREHYRGPQREHRGSREYVGEQIIVPHREPRRLSSYPPKLKAIGYGEPWISGHRSPEYPRSPSPRRAYGVPGLLYPHEVREADERSEHYVDNYMRRDRLEDARDRELDERERAVARKERALRRVSQSYGYVSDGRYR